MGIRRLAAQIDTFMVAVTALTAAQGAAVTVQAPPEAPAAQGVQMAQNTQEFSLTTPVLF
jgi:hypothetical protein